MNSDVVKGSPSEGSPSEGSRSGGSPPRSSTDRGASDARGQRSSCHVGGGEGFAVFGRKCNLEMVRLHFKSY